MTRARAAARFPRFVAEFLLILPVLLFSVVLHEFAHAWTAYREGDETAYRLGRLTLNPIVHLDPFASFVVPVGLWLLSSGAFTFGAARPVPVVPANYRRPVRGDLIVSSAGVVANAMLAAISVGVYALLGVVGRSAGGTVFATLQRMASAGITLNILLAFFNLLPLPPLDGSHLLVHALPRAWRERYRAFGKFGMLALMLALFLAPGVWDTVLWPVSRLSDIAAVALAPYTLPTP